MTPIRVTGEKKGPGGHRSFEFEVVPPAEKTLARIERCALSVCWPTIWLDGRTRCVSCGRPMGRRV